MDVKIRLIAAADKESWNVLYYSYLDFYESQPIDSSSELLWERLTKENPEIQGLVAEIGDEIVGIAHFHYQLSTWTHTSHCYLEDLYVGELARGKGVATALIAEVKRLAIEQKCSELFWITKKDNLIARKLYDKVATASDFIRYEIMLED